MLDDYKITFKDGSAGFPASNLIEAHTIAKTYAGKRWYLLYRKDKGEFVKVGDGQKQVNYQLMYNEALEEIAELKELNDRLTDYDRQLSADAIEKMLEECPWLDVYTDTSPSHSVVKYIKQYAQQLRK